MALVRQCFVFGVSVFLILAPKPHVELKPTNLPANGSPLWRNVTDAKAVWIDGRDTGKRIPAVMKVNERSNRRGDIAGTFYEDFNGGYIGTTNQIFSCPKGRKFALLPDPRKSDNPRVEGIDAKGNVLAVDSPNAIGPIMDDPKAFRRAYLRRAGAWVDLGAADEAQIDADGTIRGRYSVDQTGRPTNIIANVVNDTRVVRGARFVWRNGRRRNLR